MAEVSDFRAARDDLLGQREKQGSAFCRAYVALVDSFLSSLLPPADGIALVAVGGYGRGELCPGSDVDVVLLHGRRARDVQSLAEAVWYPLWDSRLKVGHAVRTVKEALALASGDLETATSLLDVRLVAGDTEVAGDLSERARAQWEARSGKWLAALATSVAQRHEAAGEVAFLLEPDLKEGRGGLRDVHALRWAEAAHRILLPGDDATLESAHEVLLAARIELQRRTGKASDLLLLQEQDAVAAALGDRDADALMARVAAAARTVAWTSDEAWERISSSLRGPSGRVAAADRPLGPGLVLREGAVELSPGTDPATDPTIVLRAAAAAAIHAGARIGRATLDRLAKAAPAPGDPWPDAARTALVQLLASGRAAIPVLEALDQKGLLVRTVPEWEPVRHRPQRNAYHRFTVDRHLWEAAAEAAPLAHRVSRPDLLVVGAWLHDLGKGYAGVAGRSGDHSVAGAEVVEGLATRMGFPAADVGLLVAMVRHHLLLPDAATRRDLDDAATVESVAEAVGDPATLELLHVLTEADSAATGPAAWSSWKKGLVDALVSRVAAVLAGQQPASSEFPGPAHLALAARVRDEGEMVFDARGPWITVAAPDRPGLFCRVAGTLTVHGLDVLAARAWSGEDGVAVEDFRVEPVLGGEPRWEVVEADLRRALSGRFSLESRLAERARAYAGRARLAAAVPTRSEVTVTNEASGTSTVVEVRAPDRVGTLYRITRALADLELDIRHAKVSTLGPEVVDVFYVVNGSGTKITDPEHVAEIERAVAFELSRA